MICYECMFRRRRERARRQKCAGEEDPHSGEEGHYELRSMCSEALLQPCRCPASLTCASRVALGSSRASSQSRKAALPRVSGPLVGGSPAPFGAFTLGPAAAAPATGAMQAADAERAPHFGLQVSSPPDMEEGLNSVDRNEKVGRAENSSELGSALSGAAGLESAQPSHA